MARSVEIWQGRSDDAKIPDRVRDRVFEKYQGRCYITGHKLQAGEWDCDHIKSLKDGGKHSEDNLAPIYRPAHKIKTAQENHARAKVTRTRMKHLGIKKPKGKIQSRGFKPQKSNTKFIERFE